MGSLGEMGEVHRLTLLLDEKSAALRISESEVQRRKETQSAMDQRMSALQNRLLQRDREVAGLQGRISSLETSLEEKDRAMAALAAENRANDEKNSVLKHAIREADMRRAEWKKEEERLVRELREVGSLVDEKSVALEASEREARTVRDRCQSMSSCIESLQQSVKEKVSDLNRYKEACGELEFGLSSSEDDKGTIRAEMERQMDHLRRSLAAAELQLKQTVAKLAEAEKEADSARTSLACREAETEDAQGVIRRYKEKCDALEFSVATLQGRVAEQVAEMKRRDEQTKELGLLLAEAEAKIDSNDRLMRELQDRMEAEDVVCSKLGRSQERVRQLETEMAELSGVLAEKDECIGGLSRALEEMDKSVHEAVGSRKSEMERRMADWARREAAFTEEIQELERSIEEKSAALEVSEKEGRAVREQCRSMQECIETIQESSKEKAAELLEYKEACTTLQAALRISHEEMAALKEEKGRQLEELRGAVSAAEVQLHRAKFELGSREHEIDELTKVLAGKEEEVAAANERTRQYRERNSALEFSVQTLQGRVAEQQSEIQHGNERVKEVCSLLATAETKLSENESLIKELQVKLEVGVVVARKLSESEMRVRELEDVVSQTISSAQDKDERLAALVEAAEQLSRAKADVARATKELEDRKSEWRIREEELVEELEQMQSELRSARGDVESRENQVRELREKCCSLEFSVERLEERVAEQVAEVQRSDERLAEVCSALAKAESEITSDKGIIREMELKLEVSDVISGKLSRAEERNSELEQAVAAIALERDAKVRDLETDLLKLRETVVELGRAGEQSSALAREKDEKLTASEWTIEQLGNDIYKAKAAVTAAEREAAALQYKCEDLERQLKSRDEELAEMEGIARGLQQEMTFNAVEAGRTIEEARKYQEGLLSRLGESEERIRVLEETMRRLEVDKAQSERKSGLAMETLLADWQSKVQIALEEKEAFGVEHRRALWTIEELRGQLRKKAERQERLDEINQAQVAMLQVKLAAKEAELKRAVEELRKVQIDNKGVMQRMLSLHESLVIPV